MRIVHVEATVPYSIEILWDIYSHIETYPSFVPFLKKAYRIGELKEGSIWYDVTTVLWIPGKYKHVMTRIQKHKEVSFDVILPMGGYMNQRFLFSPQKTGTKVVGEITFSLGNPISDLLIGPILQKRLTQMLEGTEKNVSKVIPTTK